jgi:uncharacterized protein YjiS (DUF1127 family)
VRVHSYRRSALVDDRQDAPNLLGCALDHIRGSQERAIYQRKWHCHDFLEQAMSVISLSKTATPTEPLRAWNTLASTFDQWWHRIRSRYELESLSERDLADMGMTRIDAFNEIQKPFWQK